MSEGHTLLSAGLLDLRAGTDADQAVVRLELLQGLLRVVDQSEAGALATTVLRAEPEDGHLVLVGLVQVGQLLAELILGDVGAVGVEDVPVKKKIRSLFPNRTCVCVCVCVLLAFLLLSCIERPVESSMAIHKSRIPTHRSHSPRTGVEKGSLTRPSACGPAEGCG